LVIIELMALDGCQPVLWLRAGALCWILGAIDCKKYLRRRLNRRSRD
jgi:hypothetical protein